MNFRAWVKFKLSLWKQPSLSPLEWHTSQKLVRHHFRQQLEDPAVAEKFNVDFVKAVTGRRSEAMSLQYKLVAFNLTVAAFMATSLAVGDMTFNLLGVTATRTDQLVEVAFFMSGPLGFFLTMLNLTVRQSGWVLDELADWSLKGEAAPYLKMAHAGLMEGAVNGSPNPKPHVFLAPLFVRWSRFLLAIMNVAAILFIGGTFAIHVAVAWRMIVDPAIGPLVSRSIVVFVSFFDILSLGFSAFMFFPLPFRNYTDVNELAPVLEKEGSDVWWPLMQARLAARKKPGKITG